MSSDSEALFGEHPTGEPGTAVAVIPARALTLSERVVSAFAGCLDDTALTALAASSQDIVTITNQDGREQVHAMRMVLKTTRLDIVKTGKASREDAQKFSKAVIAEENRRVALIEPEETRLDNLQTDFDEAIERERQARVDAELARQGAIDARIEAIRRMPLQAGGKTSEHARGVLEQAKAIQVGDDFAERAESAAEALQITLAALTGIIAEREAHEAEQARIVADREELARLREEENVRQAAERKRIADEALAAKVAQDAENARLEAQRKAQREEDDRQAAVRQKALDEQAAENKRIRDEQEEAARVERQRIADEATAAQKARDEQAAKVRAEVELQRDRTSVIDSIRNQAIVAINGRSDRKGGTIECIELTLEDTERWVIDPDFFGPMMTDIAQQSKASALNSIRELLRAAKDRAAEDARLAAARAEIERQQADLKKAAEPAPAPEPALPVITFAAPNANSATARIQNTWRPSAFDLVTVLASHYRAMPDTIIEWLSDLDFTDPNVLEAA